MGGRGELSRVTRVHDMPALQSSVRVGVGEAKTEGEWLGIVSRNLLLCLERVTKYLGS